MRNKYIQNPSESFIVSVFATIIGASLAFLLLVNTVAAQNQNQEIPENEVVPVENTTIAENENTIPAPIVTDIDNGGNILLRGIVQEVGPDFFTVRGWGGIWTVRTYDDGVVTPSGPDGAHDISTIEPGHLVGTDGTIATDQDWTVDATFVRNWTREPYTGPDAPGAVTPPTNMTSEDEVNWENANPQSLESNDTTMNTLSLQTISDNDMSTGTTALTDGESVVLNENVEDSSLMEDVSATTPDETFWQGSVSNVGYRSFTLTDDQGNVHDVFTGSGSEVLKSDGSDAKSLFFGLDLEDGSRVDVTGVRDENSNTIDATNVRVVE